MIRDDHISFLVEQVGETDVSPEEFKRSWKFGFYFRCITETAPNVLA